VVGMVIAGRTLGARALQRILFRRIERSFAVTDSPMSKPSRRREIPAAIRFVLEQVEQLVFFLRAPS